VVYLPARGRDASMALRWTAAAMQEAAKGFRRLKACKRCVRYGSVGLSTLTVVPAHVLEQYTVAILDNLFTAVAMLTNKGRDIDT
jgi:hypothetical protein